MIMKKQKPPCFLMTLLLLALVLSACQKAFPTIDPPTPTPNQIRASETPRPSPSVTNVHEDTLTPTIEPSPEYTQTPKPTATPDPPNLSLTPLPEELSPITKFNLDQIAQLAIWGNGAINEILLSGDNSLLAVTTDLGTLLYDSFDFRFLTLLRSEKPVSAIAFSPNNEWIAMIEGSSQLTIYNQPQFEPITGQQLSAHPNLEQTNHILFFSPDSDHLTLLIENEEKITVARWEVATWESVAHFSVQAGLVYFVNQSIGVLGVVTEENLILHSLVLPGDSRILPLRPNLGEVRKAIQTSNASSIIPAPSGDFLLLNQGNSVAYWDILDNQIVYKLKEYLQQELAPCDAIPDTCKNEEGGFSFSCASDLAPPPDPIQYLAITSDDQRMLISLSSNKTELRSTHSGELIWEADTGYTKVLFALNDQFVLGLRADGVLEKRNLLDGELLLTLQQHPSQFFDMDFSPDGSLLAAGFNDGWVRIYNTQTGEMLGVLEGSAHSLRFAPDGDLLAAGLVDGTLRVFQLERGRFFDLGSGHLGSVTGMAFSPDGLRLLTTSLDCTISHWDVKNRYRTKMLNPLSESPIRLLDAKQSSNLPILYTTSAGVILAIEDDLVTRVFSLNTDGAFSNLALSQDEQYLAAGGTSLWLFKQGQTGWDNLPVQAPPALQPEGVQVAFLADAGLLLAVNQQTLSFYDIKESEMPIHIHQRQGFPSFKPPLDIKLSPQGDLIVIATSNGLVYIYGISTSPD
jgi:WD40 repeat protein